MPRKYPALKPTPQSKDLPATQGMLYLVRTELKSDLNGLRSELKSGITELRTQMEVGFANLTSEVTRIALLVEEQNARLRGRD